MRAQSIIPLICLFGSGALGACGDDASNPGVDTAQVDMMDARDDESSPDIADDTSEDATPDVLGDASGDASADVADSADTDEDVSGDVSDAGETSDIAEDTTTDSLDDALSDSNETTTPDALDDTSDDTTSEVSPDTAEDTTPDPYGGLVDAALRAVLLAETTLGHTPLGYNGGRDAMYAVGGVDDVGGRIECIYTGRTVDATGSRTPNRNCQRADGTPITCNFNTEHTWARYDLRLALTENSPAYNAAEGDIHHLRPSVGNPSLASLASPSTALAVEGTMI